jgi:hypothetical protein
LIVSILANSFFGTLRAYKYAIPAFLENGQRKEEVATIAALK